MTTKQNQCEAHKINEKSLAAEMRFLQLQLNPYYFDATFSNFLSLFSLSFYIFSYFFFLSPKKFGLLNVHQLHVEYNKMDDY